MKTSVTKPLIAVIDYNMGNLRSVGKALESVGARIVVSNKFRDLESADGVVFPGVGAFGPALAYLRKNRLDCAIEKVISDKKPFLGLCLGFQLLFDFSEEGGKHNGLGIIPGYVTKFSFGRNPQKRKVPHMGWNTVVGATAEAKKRMLEGIDNSYFYFVHSYYGIPKQAKDIASRTSYGVTFCSSVMKGNVWGCQFHPEKSSTVGLSLLKNFMREVKTC